MPFLWRFHALHHSDPDVDVTTTVRLHPIEYLLNSGVFWLTVILLGIPATVAQTYGLTAFAIEAVQHGNIRLPEWMERCLQPILVTVDMHRIHHSVALAQASCNYAERHDHPLSLVVQRGALLVLDDAFFMTPLIVHDQAAAR